MKYLSSVFFILCLMTTGLAEARSIDAEQFAAQAGVVAGAAQACGQNVSIFMSRVIEVVNVLGKEADDRESAMLIFEKSMASAQLSQSRDHVMNCGEVIKSYNSLPLLRPDYKDTILPKMTQTPGADNRTTPNANQSSTLNNSENKNNGVESNSVIGAQNTMSPATPPSTQATLPISDLAGVSPNNTQKMVTATTP